MKKYLFLIPILFPVQSFAFLDSVAELRLLINVRDVVNMVTPVLLFITVLLLVRALFLRIKYRRKSEHKKENKRVWKIIVLIAVACLFWAGVNIFFATYGPMTDIYDGTLSDYNPYENIPAVSI